MPVNISDIVHFTGLDPDFNPYPQMDKRYGPYKSISAALSALPTSVRCVGLTVGIDTNGSIKEYWFKDGTSNSHLIEKLDDSYNNYRQKGGVKTRDAFYKSLKDIIDSAAHVVVYSNVDNVKVIVTVSKNSPSTIGNSISDDTMPMLETNTLEIRTRDLNSSIIESERLISVNVGNNQSNFVLNNEPFLYNYETKGRVRLQLSPATFEHVIGFYNTKTGELLSNSSSYEFDTPQDGKSYITIKFKTGTEDSSSSTKSPISTQYN